MNATIGPEPPKSGRRPPRLDLRGTSVISLRLAVAVWVLSVLLVILWMPNPKAGALKAGDSEDIRIATKFLRDNAASLNLMADISDLKQAIVRRFNGGKHVHFQQYFSNIPVFDGGINVTVLDDGTIGFTACGYKPHIQLADTTPTRSLQDIELSVNPAPGTGPKERIGPWVLMVFRDQNGQDHLAWHFISGVADTEVKEVLVDAHTAEVLFTFSVQEYQPNQANQLRELFPAYYEMTP